MCLNFLRVFITEDDVYANDLFDRDTCKNVKLFFFTEKYLQGYKCKD